MFHPRAHGLLTRIHMASTFLGRPVYAVSAYAFADLLIDTGPPQRAARLVAWCRGSAVRRVVLTHHHEDHVGGAAALQEELGLPILAPASAVPILAEGLRMPLYRRAVWRTPRRFRAEPLGDAVEGENAGERLAAKIRWWEELGERARELRDQELTVEAIARRLLGREGLLVWFSLGDFSRENLIRGLLAEPPGPVPS